MNEDDDILSREVSISARLDEGGIDLKTKSRTIAAIDSLMAGWFGPWLAKREAERRAIQAEGRVREHFILAQGEMAKERLQSGQSGDQVIDAVIVQESRRLANRAAIAEESIETLKSLPPPSAEELSESPESISEDWLNVFGSLAENASSERLRQLLGSILAGEIRRPGAFSLTTLRTAAELDKDIAEKFQEFAKTRLHRGTIPVRIHLSGPTLDDLMFLEEVGLLQGVSPGIGQNLGHDKDGIAFYGDGDYVLRINVGPGRPAYQGRVYQIRITRAGQELASLLPVQPPDFALRIVASNIEDEVESIELCKVLERHPDGTFTYGTIEQLK